MATTMEGAFTVPADIATVWAGLNDPAVLKACISGCRTLDKIDDTNFVATARVKIGPVGASFGVKVELQDVDAPNGCRILAEGQGGIVGFARGTADVRLEAVPEGTRVTYSVEASLGGRLTHLAGRLIDGVAKRMADQFFRHFVAAIAPRETAA